jgi:thiol-disulfide isomerase/thioredoxin
MHALKALRGRPLVLMFICNHCPYVKAIEERLLTLGRDYRSKAHFLAICSNDCNDYPEDAPAELAKRVREKNYPFPYLIDESQEVARAYGAVCTPDLYVYDSQHRLAYRGRLDDSWRAPEKVQHQELKQALDSLLAGSPAPSEQNPSMGCSIKWKKE